MLESIVQVVARAAGGSTHKVLVLLYISMIKGGLHTVHMVFAPDGNNVGTAQFAYIPAG
jgi:hypothetical protein